MKKLAVILLSLVVAAASVAALLLPILSPDLLTALGPTVLALAAALAAALGVSALTGPEGPAGRAPTLRHGETVFLDDMTVEELSQGLGVPVVPVDQDGFALFEAIFGV